MSMPWDTPPNNGQPNNYPPPGQPYVPPPTPPYVPPAGQPYPPQQPYPQRPQQMQPDIPPVVARNPQTGETVRVDIGTELREAIRQAITQSVVDNKDAMAANTNRAIAKMVKAEVKEEVEEQTDNLEASFSGGPATTRTFIQGAALDIGAAVMAVVATMVGPDTDIFSTELWTLVGVMMLKTILQTFMSYAIRFKAS